MTKDMSTAPVESDRAQVPKGDQDMQNVPQAPESSSAELCDCMDGGRQQPQQDCEKCNGKGKR